MSESAPLRLVDANGEVVGEQHECPYCQEKQDQLDGAERDIKSWRAKYYEAARDREARARKAGLWPRAARLFETWRRVCVHPKSEWTLDRYMLVEPLLKKYDDERFLRAIAGARFDAFETTRRNGSKQRHDGWDLIFRSAGKLEEFEARAPAHWRLLLDGLEAKRVPDEYADVCGDVARIWCPGPLGVRPCFRSVLVAAGGRSDCRCGRSYVFELGQVWAARR